MRDYIEGKVTFESEEQEVRNEVRKGQERRENK